MRNFVVLLLLWALASAGPLAAAPATLRPQPLVPASFNVLGLRLVLNEEAQRLVQQKADGLSRHLPTFQARVAMADAAFPIIDRVLKEEGVPLDFRYLALQESGLQGDAQSVHDATGYWQFKRETAAGLGLVMNNEVDERKHLTASTRAAARYLIRNNASLRNWLNTLLSYNLGLTGVKPYTLPTDVDATEMAITGASSPYVLMFLAHKVAYEPACGLNPKPPLRLQEFPALAGQTLEAQARTLSADPTALVLHNRWLLTRAVPTDRAYTLIVPITDAAQAAGLLANQRIQSRKELLNPPAVNAANTAEVRVNDLRALIALPGETTADLARRGNRRLRDFLRYNELTAFDAAVTGRPYFLESKRDEAAVEYHVLLPGETVQDVAQKYGIRRKAILTKNRLSRVDELRPGRVLWLQHVRPREVAVEYRSTREGMGLEQTRNAARRPAPEVAVASQPVERPAASREAAPAASKRSAAQRRRKEDDAREGWGDALPGPGTPAATASTTTAPAVSAPVATAPVATAPVPAPVRPAAPAPVVAQLPPPASAPAPAPLADEPPQPAPATEPTVTRAPVVAKPAPASAPSQPVVAEAPRPAAPAPKPTALPAPAPVLSAAVEATHRVEPRETVYSISRRYQIPPATLMAINNLTPPAILAVGQVLVLKSPDTVPAAAVVAPVPAAAPRPAVAQPTGRTNPAAIYVPKASAPASPAALLGPTIQHTVAGGETLYSISRLYQVTVTDLQAWNGKTDPSVKTGEVLRVQAGLK